MKKKLVCGGAGKNTMEASQARACNAVKDAAHRAAQLDPAARKLRVPKDERKFGWVKGCKERGEWAELCFMARAAGLGMGVLKPFGDSLRFDVGVLSGEKIWRVQVKSTIYSRRGNEYSLNVMGPGRKQYRKGSVDFFAVYLVPVNQWYIIPYEAMGKQCTVHFTPGGKRQKYAAYLEAWGLLRGSGEQDSAVARLRSGAGTTGA